MEVSVAFDWKTFLTRNSIPFTIGGLNTSRGNYGLKCPWCGEGDTSQHLGINPKTGQYNCWRNSEHRGASPTKLIQALLGCSYAQARAIVGDPVRPDLSELDNILEGFDSLNKQDEKCCDAAKELAMPRNFYKIENRGSFRPYFNYLIEKRGFNSNDIDRLVSTFDLRCCLTGDFSGRVIIPIYHNGLVGWTGRAISSSAQLRYLSTSESSTENVTVNIKNTLYGYDSWITDPNAHTLFIHEGPMDAIKMDFFGKPHGVRATCLYTITATETQRLLLSNISSKFTNMFVMLDAEFYSESCKLANSIMASNIAAMETPTGFKDPGELTQEAIEKIISNIACKSN